MMSKIPPRIWKSCSCVESREGRCKPKGMWIIKIKTACYMFPNESKAKEFLSASSAVESPGTGLPGPHKNKSPATPKSDVAQVARDRDQFRKLALRGNHDADEITDFLDTCYDETESIKVNYQNYLEMNR